MQNLNAAMDSYMLTHPHLVPDWMLLEVRIYIWWNQWHSTEKSQHLYRNKADSNFNNLNLNLISRATQHLCCLISLLFERWQWLFICFAYIYPANCTFGIYAFVPFQTPRTGCKACINVPSEFLSVWIESINSYRNKASRPHNNIRWNLKYSEVSSRNNQNHG